MRNATRLALAVCAGVLWAGSAFAQDTYDVTFQVDMSACIIGGQFDPDTDTVTTPGTMNDWSNTAFPLEDADDDGVYTGTYALEAGDIAYKFYATPEPPLGWEMDPNREYTVTTEPDQVIPVDDFRAAAGCGAAEDYEILFSVDMTVAIQRGAFDESEQEVYVAGALNGWDTSGNTDYRLTESSTDENVYTGVIQATGLATPSTQPYKFVTRRIADGTLGWESDPNKTFEITGDEPDANGNGFQEIIVPLRFFDNITFDQVLTAQATVTFEIDMRPAFYLLEDTGEIPGDASGGNPQTSFTDVWLNGPVATESEAGGGPGGDPIGWIEPWDPSGLGGYDEFRATDADGDSVYTITFEYPAGALRQLVGKLGAGSYDNEAAIGNDHYFVITEGTQTIEKAFGAMRQQNGLYNDDNGPGGPLYDPYLLIAGSHVAVVRSGGEADGTNTATEPDALPDGVTLGAGYPNPFATSARIAFRLERAQDVTLRVYDLTGRLVATLVEGFQPAGDHTATLSAQGLASGTYIYRLEADGRVASRTVTLVK